MSRRPHAGVPLSVAPTIPFHEPDLVPEHKAAVVKALRWAWLELLNRDPSIVKAADEETITSRLQELLNERVGGVRHAAWLEDFESVPRGERQRTADGRINKQPDLTFRPPTYGSVMNSTRWGWFVECKIIDGKASVTAYRDHGVQRFSTGEYAAWMPSGAMLGYVRDGSRPRLALNSVLPGNVSTKRHDACTTDDQSESEHDRSRIANPCVDVTLTHIWLAAT